MSAGEKSHFSSFNFPSISNSNQSFLEYGNTALLNLDVDEKSGKIRAHSGRENRRGKFQLVAKQPSLPFLSPNNRSCIPDIDQIKIYEVEDPANIGWKRYTKEKHAASKARQHVQHLFSDHPEKMFACTAELLQNELVDSGFHTCYSHSNDDVMKFVERNDERHKMQCRLCRNLAMYRTKKLSFHSKNFLGTLHEGLADIPVSLVIELLNESYEQKMNDLYYNSLQGNNLACLPLVNSARANGESSSLLCYPSGPNLEVLNTCILTDIDNSRETDAAIDAVGSPCLSIASSQQFQLQGRLNQLDCAFYTPDQVLIGARTQYQCSFLSGVYDSDGMLLSVKPAKTLASSEQVMSMTISPYIYGEAVVAMETGCVHLWSVDKGLTNIWQSSAIYERADSWYQAVFAAHPREIVLASSTGADLLDFRVGLLSEKALFSLPSSQFSSFERISAVQRHRENTHHYLIATDQSLVIIDDRFVQNPVLKWRHHLQDPGQFLEVVSGSLPDCDDTVIVLSGSRHYESHCYQYCFGHTDTHSSMQLRGEVACLPPLSTSLQWKVSPYDEWPLLSHRKSAIPPEVTNQLSRPLIGLGVVPHTDTFGGGFTVLQLSAAGNLFQQQFKAVPVDDGSIDIHSNYIVADWQLVDKTASVRTDRFQTELTEINKKKCNKWVEVFTATCSHYADTAIACNAADKTNLFLRTTYLPEAHPACSVCSRTPRALECTADSQMTADSFCKRCGLDLSYTAKLKELQLSDKIVTHKNLNIKPQTQQLSLISGLENSRDPLSKCLLWNWNSDEPKPLELELTTDATVPVGSAAVEDRQSENVDPLDRVDSTSRNFEETQNDLQQPSRPSSTPLSINEELTTPLPADQLLLGLQINEFAHSSSQIVQSQERVLRENRSTPVSPSQPHPANKLTGGSAKKPREHAAHRIGF